MNLEQDSGLFGLGIKFNLKSVIIFVLLAIGIYFLIPKIIGAQEALRLILHVNKFYLALAIFFEIISYVGAATLLGIILSRLKYKLRFWDRFRISSIASFAIHFFPVSSFGEGAIDYFFLRKKKVEPGSILLMLVLRIILTYMAFLLIFLVGLALVPTAPHLPFSPRIISLVLFLIVAGGTLYIFYLYRNKENFHRLWKKFIRFADFFASKFRGRKLSQEKEEELFEDIYTGIGLFGEKKRSTVFAIMAAIVYWMGDIVCFYFVFLSFGFHILWGVLIFTYGVSWFIGMITFIPGGLGVTEGSLGLIFSGLAVPSSIALMSILVFRFFSFWIWVPFGLYSYISLMREGK